MRDLRSHVTSIVHEFPSVDAEVHRSPQDVPYLREHGVALIGQTSAYLDGVRAFLRGFEDFEAYVDETFPFDCGTQLSKFAGQLCYMSLGHGRTTAQESEKYVENLKAHGHGSVLEHPTYTLLFYGIDRAVTHELVRHRAGKAYSQVSQRYVGPEMLRYVMPAEMQGDDELEGEFFDDSFDNRRRYARRIDRLMEKRPTLPGESKVEKRKRVQSFARRILANEVEAPIVVTGNARSWRHVIQMRCGKAADRAIRAPIFDAWRILNHVNDTMFTDFTAEKLPDGTFAAEPKYSKV